MFVEVEKALGFYFDDPIFGEELKEACRESRVFMASKSCTICGGCGHIAGLDCGTAS